jgi:hypothetical protein
MLNDPAPVRPLRDAHVCKTMRYCVCSVQALEPDEDCPIHGCAQQPRCECGRFVRTPPQPESAKETDS